LQKSAERIAILLRRVLPVSPDRIPAVAQAFLIGITVLGDDRRDSLRMFDREPESRRSAVVEDVYGIGCKADDLGETVDLLGDAIERIAAWWHIRLPEPRKVRRDDVEAVRQEGNQLAKHMAGGREAVKQKQFGRACRPALSIKEVEAIDVGRTVLDGIHS